MLESAMEKNSRPRILILDDEAIVTQSIQTMLELETDYRVFAYNSAADALHALLETAVDLVISDFYMPEMDGLQFLKKVKKMYPDTPRILLTGYSDKENAIKGINKIGLFQYIEKPWDNEHLLLTIRNGIANTSLTKVLHYKIKELETMLRRVDELTKAQDRFKTELLLARNVQERMLPQEFPGTESLKFAIEYRPAMEIGGDFYNVIPLQNNKIAVLLADITGHGIQAALVTILIKLALHQFINSSARAREIMSGMNSFLSESLPSGIYVAAIVVVVDLETGACVVINGGNPHPVKVSRQFKSIQLLPTNGMLLGLMKKDEFSGGDEIEIDLDSGEFLLIYTDGIVEYQMPEKEFFGDEKMYRVIQEHIARKTPIILRKMIESAKAFDHLNPTPDDITMIGIEKK